MNGYPLTWVGRTPNKKTGDIPSAYVGADLDECRASCSGCSLYETTCYAWRGFTRASFGRIEVRRAKHPELYTLDHALATRWRGARAARIGVMGDPARGDNDEVLGAIKRLTREGLAPIVYTHFWRETWAQHLRPYAMASCEFLEDAERAVSMGWRPALVLPWDYLREQGSRFVVAGKTGVVCPAQTKPAVTCNDCRMCWTGHPVWQRGKLQAIGFLDHSHAARREAKRMQGGRQLPLYGRAVDTRPARTGV